MIMRRWRKRIAVYLVGLVPLAALAQAVDWREFRRLDTAEITATFAGVRDDALVQDGSGGSAVNHWYADGRFTSEWQAGGETGIVRGRWFARDDKRCVVIESGLPSLEGESRCGPVYTRDGKYYSVNAEGGIHGIHTLSPLGDAGEAVTSPD